MTNAPDIRVGGLSVWIRARQFPGATEYYDANWLIVDVACEANGAIVRLDNEPCLMTAELAEWRDHCADFLAGATTIAELPAMEPYLSVLIERRGAGDAKTTASRPWRVGIWAKVRISHDNVTQFHEFQFPLDKSDVERLTNELSAALARYPVHGAPPRRE